MLGALVTVAIVSPVHAGDAFAFTDACDELSLARAAEAAGDTALTAALEADRYRAVLAIRASEHARAPELLIPALAAHACGRDPTLAPEAAAALRKLARRLTPSELADREALQRDLERARTSLHCEHAPRADIAAALAELAAAL
ncbi:MAG TPA: hypothetical protein VFX59_08650 [Polyangiales bacterium]|nr:hypothetical protein [Polyangiales bacterium]